MARTVKVAVTGGGWPNRLCYIAAFGVGRGFRSRCPDLAALAGDYSGAQSSRRRSYGTRRLRLSTARRHRDYRPS